MIQLNKTEWAAIWTRIKDEYPRSVWMLTYKLKEELGFTVRKHRVPPGDINNEWPTSPKIIIYLDFYDEQLEVYFRLKYL